MNTENHGQQEWLAVEKKLRFIYGDEAYQRITEDWRWRSRYCERRKKLAKQLERLRRAIVTHEVFPSLGADQKMVARINRHNSQRGRRLKAKLTRKYAIERLGPIDCAANLVTKMYWHPHNDHIWAVATYPGVTSQQLTDDIELISSNHRMVFRRLNNDLYHVGWQFVASPIGFKNESWGWYLEKI